jgi:hypothetical protein
MTYYKAPAAKRDERASRAPGATKVSLWDLQHPASAALKPSLGHGRWATICHAHGEIAAEPDYEAARGALPHPYVWCAGCNAAWKKANPMN